MTNKNEKYLIKLLADIYNNAPKDHNPKGYLDEFVSRMRASVNVKSMREFYSKLIRKTGCKSIYDGWSFGRWIDSLTEEEEYDILQELQMNGSYYILLAREDLQEFYNDLKNKKEKGAEVQK